MSGRFLACSFWLGLKPSFWEGNDRALIPRKKFPKYIIETRIIFHEVRKKGKITSSPTIENNHQRNSIPILSFPQV